MEDLASSSRLLYSYWLSSCSWRVRFALNLKGLQYEYKSVDLFKGEQFSPGTVKYKEEILLSLFSSNLIKNLLINTNNQPICAIAEFEQINPLHYVPVLVDDGVVVSDSLAIIMFLEEKYPQNQLLPADFHRRALNLQVASIVSSSMQPLHMKSVMAYIEEKVTREESITWSQMITEKGFSALEKLLKDVAGKYSTGDEASMADVFLAPQISIAISRFNIDMSKYPTLFRVYESCEALPEFQAAIPERQPDAKTQ